MLEASMDKDDHTTPPLWAAGIAPDIEPRQIAIQRGDWVDSARNGRKIPYKLYHPTPLDDGPYPVIIWSHGLGGSRDGAGFISRFIAAHGYIVVHIQHHGTDSSLWEGKPGHPWDVIRNTHIPKHATLNRLKDVPFALDQLNHHELRPFMDFSRLGMSGHSFGGMTTQVMAGQKRGFGKRQYSLHESRFKAGIIYSPSPQIEMKSHGPQDFYGAIKIPLLIMTGTDDDSPLRNFGYERRLDVFTHSGGPDQHLLVLDQGDHMVYNGSRGKLEANPKQSVHEDIIKILSLAFWNAYLKNDPKAKEWLTGASATSWLSGEADYTYRP